MVNEVQSRRICRRGRAGCGEHSAAGKPTLTMMITSREGLHFHAWVNREASLSS
jgi:hypothetical protein